MPGRSPGRCGRLAPQHERAFQEGLHPPCARKTEPGGAARSRSHNVPLCWAPGAGAVAPSHCPHPRGAAGLGAVGCPCAPVGAQSPGWAGGRWVQGAGMPHVPPAPEIPAGAATVPPPPVPSASRLSPSRPPVTNCSNRSGFARGAGAWLNPCAVPAEGHSWGPKRCSTRTGAGKVPAGPRG